jgi:hypothetical protein
VAARGAKAAAGGEQQEVGGAQPRGGGGRRLVEGIALTAAAPGRTWATMEISPVTVVGSARTRAAARATRSTARRRRVGGDILIKDTQNGVSKARARENQALGVVCDGLRRRKGAERVILGSKTCRDRW